MCAWWCDERNDRDGTIASGEGTRWRGRRWGRRRCGGAHWWGVSENDDSVAAAAARLVRQDCAKSKGTVFGRKRQSIRAVSAQPPMTLGTLVAQDGHAKGAPTTQFVLPVTFPHFPVRIRAYCPPTPDPWSIENPETAQPRSEPAGGRLVGIRIAHHYHSMLLRGSKGHTDLGRSSCLIFRTACGAGGTCHQLWVEPAPQQRPSGGRGDIPM